MKIISAHQPAYIPWLGYFHKILVCDEFIIMDDVQFEKNSFINRNRVLANGGAVMLTIPVSTTDYTSKQLREIEIADERWKIKHLRTVEQSYKRSTFFNEIFPIFEKGVTTRSKYLVDYLNSILFDLISYLNIQTSVRLASELSITSRKLDYVIELTEKVNGQAFVFGALGRSYAEENVLEEKGIRPYFQDYVHPVYTQNSTDFTPYLSVLDLLMQYGIKSVDIIQSNNVIKKQLFSNA
jgi:hypothetical protein